MPPNEVIENILKGIEPKLHEISTRPVLADLLGGMVSRRSWANLDYLGKGIKPKVTLGGRTVGYPKAAVLSWLKQNLHVIIED